MSLRNVIMRYSVLGFRSDIRIELKAPVVIFNVSYYKEHEIDIYGLGVGI